MPPQEENTQQKNPLKKRNLSYMKNKTKIARLQGSASCVYCDARVNLVVDHLVPLARGGTDHLKNLVLACGECNNLKGAMDVEGLMAKSSAVERSERYSPQDKQRMSARFQNIARVVSAFILLRSEWTDPMIEILCRGPDMDPDFTQYSKRAPLMRQSAFGEFIQARLTELGISREKCKKIMGLRGWFTFERWCDGRRLPSQINLEKLCAVLIVDVDQVKKRFYPEKRKPNRPTPCFADDPLVAFTKDFRARRCRAGFSIQDVADYVGISTTSVSNYESGRVAFTQYVCVSRFKEFYEKYLTQESEAPQQLDVEYLANEELPRND